MTWFVTFFTLFTLSTLLTLFGGIIRRGDWEVRRLSQLSSEQMQEVVQKGTMAGLGLNGNGRQKIVTMIEVRDYVLQRWEFVNNLPNGEAIIRLSDSS